MSYEIPPPDWLNDGRLWAIEFIEASRIGQSGFFNASNFFLGAVPGTGTWTQHLARNRDVAGATQISFWTQPAAGSPQAQIKRDSGLNGTLDIIQTGTGNLNIRQDTSGGFISIRATGGRIQFVQNSIEMMKIDAVNTIVSNNFIHNGSRASFFGAADITKPTVTGSRGGNAALNSALIALANLGLLTNSSTA